MNHRLLLKAINTIFFGNVFIGFCAVALCIETNFQNGLALNQFQFYSIVFCATVYYYTYLFSSNLPHTIVNNRMKWYKINFKEIKYAQRILLIFLIINLVDFLWKYHSNITRIPILYYWTMMIFPLIGFAYNFRIFSFLGIPNLRIFGWLKPLLIGFVWSGIVSVFPVIFAQIEDPNKLVNVNFPFDFLWLKNLMFVSTICIMFDLNDYEHDKEQNLQTFAVKFGVEQTIKWIIIPFAILGILLLLKFTLQHQFPIIRILVNTIPFIFLLITAFSLRKKRSIIYYLFLIDGLMIIKAICGISGILLIK
jgi:4-hydroxybenzoate polyprenyltransferase